MPIDRHDDGEHQQKPADARRIGQDRSAGHQEPSARCASVRSASSALERGLAGFLEQPQQQHDGHRGGRKRHDDAGDDQRLGHRIAAEPGCGAPARDDAEYQERAGAEEIESENLPQRLRIGDEAEQSEPDQSRAAKSEQCDGVHVSASVPADPPPAGRASRAIERVSVASTTMISGLA